MRWDSCKPAAQDPAGDSAPLLWNPWVFVCTDRVVDPVEEGFDVAIRAGRLIDSTLVARRLGSLKSVIVAAPGYGKGHPRLRSPSDLERHPCITFAPTPTPNTWLLHSGSKKVDVRISPRLSANDMEVMRDAARGGIGIA